MKQSVVFMKTKIHNKYSLVGGKIKKARQMAGLSQHELGEKICKTGAAIGYIERGERGIGVDDLISFSKILKVPINFFFEKDLSDEQLLQQTLDQLRKHVSSLNKTISDQMTLIDKLMKNLPHGDELRLLTESSLDPMVVVDRKGKILYITASIYDLIKVKASKLIGQSCFDYIKGMNSKGSSIFKQLFADKEVINYETQVKHKNGKLIDIEINAKVILRKGEPVVHAILRDISHRKKVMGKLIKREWQYRVILESSKDGIFLINQKGQILAWNKALEDLTGLKREKVEEKYIWDVKFKKLIYYKDDNCLYRKIKGMMRLLLNRERELKPIDFVDALNTCRDNKVRILETRVIPVFTGDEVFIKGVVKDVTKV